MIFIDSAHLQGIRGNQQDKRQRELFQVGEGVMIGKAVYWMYSVIFLFLFLSLPRRALHGALHDAGDRGMPGVFMYLCTYICIELRGKEGLCSKADCV